MLEVRELGPPPRPLSPLRFNRFWLSNPDLLVRHTSSRPCIVFAARLLLSQRPTAGELLQNTFVPGLAWTVNVVPRCIKRTETRNGIAGGRCLLGLSDTHEFYARWPLSSTLNRLARPSVCLRTLLGASVSWCVLRNRHIHAVSQEEINTPLATSSFSIHHHIQSRVYLSTTNHFTGLSPLLSFHTSYSLPNQSS